MVTQADVARLIDLYRRFSRGERDAVIAALPPAIEWISLDASLGVVRLRGREEVARYVSAAAAPLDALEVEPVAVRAAGDRIFIVVEQRGRRRGGRAESRFTFCHEWTYRDGCLIRFRLHLDPARARVSAPPAAARTR